MLKKLFILLTLIDSVLGLINSISSINLGNIYLFKKEVPILFAYILLIISLVGIVSSILAYKDNKKALFIICFINAIFLILDIVMIIKYGQVRLIKDIVTIFYFISLFKKKYIDN